MRLENNLFLRCFKIYQESDNVLLTLFLPLCFKSPYLLPRLLQQQPPKRFSRFYPCPSKICFQYKSQSYLHKCQSNEATVVLKLSHDSYFIPRRSSLSNGLQRPPPLWPHLACSLLCSHSLALPQHPGRLQPQGLCSRKNFLCPKPWPPTLMANGLTLPLSVAAQISLSQRARPWPCCLILWTSTNPTVAPQNPLKLPFFPISCTYCLQLNSTRMIFLFFLFWPSRSLWCSQARDQIQAAVVTYAAGSFNPLCRAWDRTCVLVLQKHCWSYCTTAGTSGNTILTHLFFYKVVSFVLLYLSHG